LLCTDVVVGGAAARESKMGVELGSAAIFHAGIEMRDRHTSEGDRGAPSCPNLLWQSVVSHPVKMTYWTRQGDAEPEESAAWFGRRPECCRQRVDKYPRC
jgi:hypothetical protein